MQERLFGERINGRLAPDIDLGGRTGTTDVILDLARSQVIDRDLIASQLTRDGRSVRRIDQDQAVIASRSSRVDVLSAQPRDHANLLDRNERRGKTGERDGAIVGQPDGLLSVRHNRPAVGSANDGKQIVSRSVGQNSRESRRIRPRMNDANSIQIKTAD